MTSTVITDEIREIGRKALGVFWDDAPARQIGLAADTFLEVVAPMILEEAAKRWQPIETAQKDGTRVFVATSTAIHTAVYDRIEGCWCVLPRRITTRVPVPGTVIGWLPLDTLPPLPLPPEPRP